MQITGMKVNGLTEPLGYRLQPLSFSWKTEDSCSRGQSAARVEIFLGEERVYDSGLRSDVDSLGFSPDLKLLPRSRYSWQVTVLGEAGDRALSPRSSFETGKEEECWLAKWITPDLDDVMPCMERELELYEAVRSARFYGAGLGLYHLFLNGERASRERFAPGFNCYDRWVQYQTYDVTALLKKGKNLISFWLGGGISKGRFSYTPEDDYAYCPNYCCIGELHIILESGREVLLCTDESWHWKPSPVVQSSIYNGEVYAPGDGGERRPVALFTPPVGPLCARSGPPVCVMQEFQPLQLLHTPAGETVLDMGQIITGWLRFPVCIPEGQSLRLQYGEILQDGCFYRENLRSAKAEYVYHSDGKAHLLEPFFTWYGFRYVKLEGFGESVRAEDFTACVVHSELEETGSIRTSNEDLNRLFRNVMWSQRGNFLDVPTDCPQRDEREGWTGDAQIFSDTACFNMDCRAFFTKYLTDLWEEQQKHGGCVPYVIPNARDRSMAFQGGAVGWGDAAAVIPWTLYVHSGDGGILARQIGSMEAWTDWAAHCHWETEQGWVGACRQFGDWLALDHPWDPERREGETEMRFLCLCYLHYSALLTAKAERVLGREAQARRYAAMAERAAEEWRQCYLRPDGSLQQDTQTACVMALYLQLCPSGPVLKQLLKLLERDGHLTTGFLGTPWLLHVLPDEKAWDLLLREAYPSWLYPVKQGATTVWERWNSVLPDGKLSGTGMNSLNHYAYGSVVAWMYRRLCGLRPLEEAPGFRRICFAPCPDKRLDWACCSLSSPMGRIRASWAWEGTQLKIGLELPFGCMAEVQLPDGRKLTAESGSHSYCCSVPGTDRSKENRTEQTP